MKNLVILFICTFAFIWGFGTAINYLQKKHSEMIGVKPNYGDFSPEKIEEDRQKAMEDYQRQVRDYKAQQSSTRSQQDTQRKFFEDQKRQLRDMQRMNAR